MYTSTEDARSDLFLSGAVFVFGAIIVEAVLRITQVERIPGVRVPLGILLPLVTTILVPFLLIRYRKEPWSMYGLSGFSGRAFGLGVALALPIALAGVALALLAQVPPLAAIPLAGADHLAGIEAVLVRTAQWLGYALLAAYGSVKARDAFRGTPQALYAGARQIAGILGMAAGIAAVLLLVSMAARGQLGDGLVTAAALLLWPVGIASAVVVMLGRARGAGTVARPTLVTPAVLMGLAAFGGLGFDAQALVRSVHLMGLFALLGLVIGLLQELRQTAWAAAGLGLAIGALTIFP